MKKFKPNNQCVSCGEIDGPEDMNICDDCGEPVCLDCSNGYFEENESSSEVDFYLCDDCHEKREKQIKE